jgi:2-dehydropantoate 2-reductase
VNEALTAMIKVITAGERTGPELMRIEGDVVRPITFTRKNLLQLPQEHQVDDIGTVIPGMAGRAVRVKGVLEIPALGVDADHVTFHSTDGQYAATLTLEQARDYGLLLYEFNGGPVPAGMGGPYRLFTPGMGDLCANVKGVVRIEVRTGTGKDTRPPVPQRTHC